MSSGATVNGERMQSPHVGLAHAFTDVRHALGAPIHYAEDFVADNAQAKPIGMVLVAAALYYFLMQ